MLLLPIAVGSFLLGNIIAKGIWEYSWGISYREYCIAGIEYRSGNIVWKDIVTIRECYCILYTVLYIILYTVLYDVNCILYCMM